MSSFVDIFGGRERLDSVLQIFMAEQEPVIVFRFDSEMPPPDVGVAPLFAIGNEGNEGNEDDGPDEVPSGLFELKVESEGEPGEYEDPADHAGVFMRTTEAHHDFKSIQELIIL